MRAWVAIALVLASCSGGGNEGDGPPGDATPFAGRIHQVVADEDGCLTEALELSGALPACRLVEAVAPEASITCLSTGRAPLDRPGDGDLADQLAARLEAEKLCGASGTSCAEFVFCEVMPLAGNAESIAACAGDPETTTPAYCACLHISGEVAGPSGYCYVDASAGIGSAQVVACAGPALRFLSSRAVPLPAPSSPRLFEVCD